MIADTPSPRPVPGRSLVATRLGIVAASQPLAARAGVQVLERGGNAVDAAIAANAVMGLMEPTGNGIGGDLFALIYDAKTGTLHGLNASGWAPRALTVEYLKGKGVETMPERGPYTVTVPGVVAGWHAMREKFGRLPFSDLLAPAMHYANDGFPVAEITAGLWGGQKTVALLQAEPNAARTFLIDGRPPSPGTIFRNPDLARSLGRIAAERTRRLLPRSYRRRHRRAAARAREPDDRGGPGRVRRRVGDADLPRRTAAGRSARFRPNGQGIAALIMLNLMEQFPMGEFGFHSPRGAAHDDRGQEAGLCGPDPLRRRSALRRGAGGGDARQAPRRRACAARSTRRVRSAAWSRRRSSA